MLTPKPADFDPSSVILEGVNIFRVLDLNLRHITPSDDAILRLGMMLEVDQYDTDQHAYHYMSLGGGYAQPIPDGWMVRVFDDTELTDRGHLQALGFSDAFINLTQLCVARRYGYLRLEAEGDEVAGLPIFEWDEAMTA